MEPSLVLKEIMTVLVILEEAGGRYYREMAEAQKDLQIRTLFVMLSNDEGRHRKIYGDLCRRWGLNAEKLAQDALVRAQVNEEFGLEEHRGPFGHIKDALESALEMERKTILYLTDLEGHLADSEKLQLKQLVNEEWNHINILSDLKGRIKK